jgi:hypothetical protein
MRANGVPTTAKLLMVLSIEDGFWRQRGQTHLGNIIIHVICQVSPAALQGEEISNFDGFVSVKSE